jgi:zinc/manganese transport system permease protein
MFSGFMVNAWEAATIVAAVAGVVGFFTVARGAAFAAHALPNGAFAGAAGASLIGANALLGLGVFSFAGAATIAGLGQRARRDVATAMTIVMMLALGSLFLSQTTEYAPAIFSLLFGEVLGCQHQPAAADRGDRRRLRRDRGGPVPAAAALLGAAGCGAGPGSQ